MQIVPAVESPVRAAGPIVWDADFPTTMVEQRGSVEIYYQTAMGNDVCKRLCAAMSAVTEPLYQRMTTMFRATNKPKMKLVITSLSKNHDGTGGGYHLTSAGTTLFTDVKIDRAARPLRYDPAFTAFVFVAEAVQPIAFYNAPGFSDDYDQGEALSRVLANVIMPGQLGPYGTVVKWLNNGRPNFLNQRTNRYVGVTIGCCSALLYFMNREMKIPWEVIISGGKGGPPGATMRDIFKKATGSSLDPYALMMKTVNAKYKPGIALPDTPENENLFD